MMPCSSSRSFPCNFCDQKFRSAQALGGHMNLHRRDRARLRNPTTALFSGSDVVLRCLFPADLKAEALESLFLQLGVSRASLKKQQSNSVKATDLYSFNMKEERVKFHSFLPEFDSGLKPEAGRKLESGKFNGDAVVGELDLELRL